MNVNGQTVLSAVALSGLIGLGAGAEMANIPSGNLQLLSTIIGALAGAVITAGGMKIADKITNSTGPDATIQSDTGEKP